MRAFADILRFELRLHLASPLFIGIALAFFVVHLLTIRETGINVSDNDLIYLNGAWSIFQTERVLGVFGMVPAIVFAVLALTRDIDRNTQELFFTTPVTRAPFVLGRFSAAALAAILIGSAGMLGALSGTLLPGLDPARIAPFDWRPWAASFALLVLPNLLIFSALFFSVAALTRSAALTFGAALGVLVLIVYVNGATASPLPQWLLMADPFGALAINETARFWSVPELNTQLPIALLLPNRLLWLTLAASALAFTLARYRLQPVYSMLAGLRIERKHVKPAPALRAFTAVPRFTGSATLQQFLAQLRMDWRGTWQSPLFWLVLVLAAFSTFSDSTNRSAELGNLPLYPATSLLLGFFRFGLTQFVMLAVIWFAGALVHRERDCGIDGITGALPCPDWIAVVTKTLALCAVLTLLMLASLAASIAVQVAAGFDEHEIGLFLKALFIYNGFEYYMLGVLAVTIQALSPGKWSGMGLTLLAFVSLSALPTLGFEHLLYGFRIPYVVHSDMNGFGHYEVQTFALIAYWSAFCVLLMVLGHLLFPRTAHSAQASWRERLRDARTRVTRRTLGTSALAGLAFAGTGAFIFHNTNILNDYVTRADMTAAAARYEREYGAWRLAPVPSLVDFDMHVELYPSARRLEARGTAVLRNTKSVPISEFPLTLDARHEVRTLAIAGATVTRAGPELGLWLFRFTTPLQPGATATMTWDVARAHRGFVNAYADNTLVANGTYMRAGPMPVPGYDIERELQYPADRRRFGLPPAEGLPELGDPAWLDYLRPGIDARGNYRIVIGTEADQIALAAAPLRREWMENGRRYFEYVMDRPMRPFSSLMSARYAVARGVWNNVALEVYHDPKHHWNAQTMLDTAKAGLDYYSREFGPYALSYFRIAEYPRYQSNVQALPGMVAYSEASGFMTDLRGWNALDYATLHELAHMWWGNVYGARMQGRQVLNEGLAQYSTFMVYRESAAPGWVRRILADTHDGYLRARGNEAVAEQPVFKSEDQGYISYNKAPLALYALQELIGADRVNAALNAYYARFVTSEVLPTTLDLLAELRAVAGPEHQQLITDLFEKIMLYDTGIVAMDVRQAAAGWDVTLDVSAHQFEATGAGAETEVPLDTWFQVALFAETDPGPDSEPLYLAHHRLHSGVQRLTIHVDQPPAAAGVDPFHLMIDRRREDNIRAP
ncbi:MAG: M1 family aminopeptidase [Gammaproteobacteria bacterium]